MVSVAAKVVPTSTLLKPSLNNVMTNGNMDASSMASIKTEPEDATVMSPAPSQNNPASNSQIKLSSCGMPRLYSRVEIALENSLLSAEKLSNPPSLQDGIDINTETDLRYLGSELIQKASILLKLPQVAAATGQVLYQRFYCAKSFAKHDFEVTAMACINLASKIEEAPRRLRDVISVFHHMRQLIQNRESGASSHKILPLVLDHKYVATKNDVIKSERRVLKELGFCVHIKHPHKIICAYLKALQQSENTELSQRAWNYMNDSLRTDVFLRYSPETISCACIVLAARDLGVPLPEEPVWYEVFDVKQDDVHYICRLLIALYRRKPPSWRQLELRCLEVKQRFADKQSDTKRADVTPNPHASDAGSSEKPSPVPSSQLNSQDSPKTEQRGDKDRRRRTPTKTSYGSRRRSRSRSPVDLLKRYSSSNDRRQIRGATLHSSTNALTDRNSRHNEKRKRRGGSRSPSPPSGGGTGKKTSRRDSPPLDNRRRVKERKEREREVKLTLAKRSSQPDHGRRK